MAQARVKSKNMALKNKVVDEVAAHELDLYAENTSQLYGQYKSIIANIKRRIKAGTYSPVLAPKLWLYWYDAAAKHYCKEFGGQVKDVFPKVTREYAAAERAKQAYAAIAAGEE
jgi:hypothetical protein